MQRRGMRKTVAARDDVIVGHQAQQRTTAVINDHNVFKLLHSRSFQGIIGMEFGNSKKGVHRERQGLAAYRRADDF